MKFRRRKLRLLFVLLGTTVVSICPSAGETAGSGDLSGAPSHVEQDSMLSAMRQYAGQYISHLPNFICSQVTQQFEAGRKMTHWRKGDTLRFRLVYLAGSEARSIESVNNKPPAGRRWRAPLSTEGEFGTLLGSVFGASTEAAFTWHGWDSIAGRKMAVFDFAVDRAHSTLKLSLSDLAQSVLPYRGSVYADPRTGEVWRISNGAYDIPPEIQTKSISTVIEYGEVPIGGTNYLLPSQASVLVDTGANHIRNEMWFQAYRKFEANSSVTYTSEGEAEPNRVNPPQ